MKRKLMTILTLAFAALGAAAGTVSVDASATGVAKLKADFERTLPAGPHPTARLLTFEGVDGWDVYNCSIPFDYAGKSYIFGRVERRDEWASSRIELFEKRGDVCTRVKGFKSLALEDPYVQWIGGELVVGGTHVTKNAKGEVASYCADFYKGKGPFDLTFFLRGPDRMKDIRLVEFKDGKIGVFSRPRGEAVRAKYGSEAVIGYTEIDSLAALTAEVIERAPVVEGVFGKDEWGGVNQAYDRGDKVLVAAHLCYAGPSATNGVPRQIYVNAAFALDRRTRTASHIRVIATRRMYPAAEPKVPHLDDTVFTSGFVFRDDGLVDVYTGVGDCREGCVTLPQFK